MIRSGIVVHWDYSDEYIEMDLDAIAKLKVIDSTIEWWKYERTFVRYNTRSRVRRLPNGTVELTITYEHDQNLHLTDEDVPWGTATITIVAGKQRGQAVWKDADDSDNNGTFPWERCSSSLVTDKKRQMVSKIERERQQRFRRALLLFESSCVLSGEKTEAALEAAHVIPVWKGGTEIVENGILLRADIHRLYDAGVFSISTSGEVVVHATDLPPSYASLLRNKRIPEATLSRVRDALTYEWQAKHEQRK